MQTVGRHDQLPRRLWAGICPPGEGWTLGAEIWGGANDCRLPGCHQTFCEVDLTAENLAEHKLWPVVLDEALRLLAPGGRLVFRTGNTRLGSYHEIMRRIFCWSRGRVILEESEGVAADKEIIASVRLMHDARRTDAVDEIDFVVLTDGQRLDRVERFIGSVRRASLNRAGYRIIIASPCSIDLGSIRNWADDCLLYVDVVGADRIADRKNRVVEAVCRAENILLVHDRYAVSETFWDELESFGGDFSVLICRQELQDGFRFPDLVSTYSDTITTRAAQLEYGDWGPYVYVNGGAVLAKRDTLREVPWNPLLQWGAREDVEWTRRLRDAGIEPRLCRRAVLISLPPRQGYLAGFDCLPGDGGAYLAGEWPEEGLMQRLPAAERRRRGDFGGESRSAVALRSGIVLGDGWVVGPGGASLESGLKGQFSLRLPPSSQRRTTTIQLYGSHVHVALVEALAAESVRSRRGCLTLKFPPGVVSGEQLTFSLTATKDIKLRYFSFFSR